MSKIDNVIQQMQVNEEYETYFFRNCTNYQNLHMWLKPLHKKGYFSPSKNPAPYEDPSQKGYIAIQNWQVLDFLEAVSIQNKESPRNEISELLLEIVNEIISFRNEDGIRTDNYRTDWYVVKVIFNLPYEYISTNHIKFIGVSLRESQFGRILDSEIERVVVPVLLENRMKAHMLELLEIIFSYTSEKDDFSTVDRKPLIEEYHLFELLERHSHAIIDLVGVEGLKIVLSKIESIISEDESSFNIVWIKTIEDHRQNQFPKRYDNQLITFTRDLLERLTNDVIQENVLKFLDCEHPIFKRLAFHLLNLNYSSLKEIFWEWFDNNIKSLNSTIRHEFYKLLSDNAEYFQKEQINKLIDWIESLDYSEYYDDATETQLEKITAIKRKEWLLTIKDFSEEADKLFQKYELINPSEIEHPGFDIWSGGARYIENESPIKDISDYSNKPVNEIVDFISKFNPDEFETDDLFQDSESLKSGLASDLEKLVIENPLKFSSSIKEFKSLDYIYKSHIIYGLEKAWKDKKAFDWEMVFEFINDEFTDTFFDLDCTYSRWFKDAVAELITAGTRSDDNAFNKNHLPISKQIIFKLLQSRNPEKKVDSNDLASYILNSVDGKSLGALINYALRYGRLNSGHSIKWEQDIKEFFTKELNQQTEYSKLFFYFVGWHLPYLQFLDNDWVLENFSKIFPISSKKLWELSISGYFRFTNTVYEDIYNLLLKNKHFDAALFHEFHTREVKRKLVDHICVMFVNDKDNETAINLIKSKKSSNVSELINSVYYLYRSKTEMARHKVLTLWHELYESYSGEENTILRETLNRLSNWFTFVEEVDSDIEPVLLMTAKCLKGRTDSYDLLKEMDRLADTNTNFVGKLFIEMLENDHYPTYEENTIFSIVEKLFLNNEEMNALRICNKYKRKGIYFLNELSAKYTN